MKFKGKYKGNKNVKLEKDPNLPLGVDVFVEVADIKSLENKKEKKKRKDNKEHFLLEIAKNAVHFGRSDLSEKYHEILYSLEPEKDE